MRWLLCLVLVGCAIQQSLALHARREKMFVAIRKAQEQQALEQSHAGEQLPSTRTVPRTRVSANGVWL